MARHAQRAVTILERDPDSVPRYLHGVSYHLLGSALIETDPERAGSLLEAAEEVCTEVRGRDAPHCWYIASTKALLALQRGDASSALELAASGVDRIGRSPRPEGDGAEAILIWARALTATGEAANVARARELAKDLETRTAEGLPSVRREFEAWRATLPASSADHSAAGSESSGR